MERIFTLIGIILAVLVIVFQLATILVAYIPIVLGIAIILIGMGVITGR